MGGSEKEPGTCFDMARLELTVTLRSPVVSYACVDLYGYPQANSQPPARALNPASR